LRVLAPDAVGLRVGLRFTALPRELELRVAQPAPDGAMQVVALTTGAQLLKLARGIFPIMHWTASTEGTEQLIELWSPREPGPASLRFVVDDVSHLLQRPIDPVRSKALTFTCHVDVMCITDPNVTQDSKAVARMVFSNAGKSFVCSGSLLADRPHSLTPLFATANHCISDQDTASSLETWWFYTATACNSGVAQTPRRLSLGATLLMANFDTDFTLLQLNESAPGGAFFLGWDGNPLAGGQSVFGIHHPDGSYQRYSSGTYLGLSRLTNSATHVTFAELFREVQYTQGIIEGGSSGSPLLITPGTFEGTLFGSPSTNSCTGGVFASYSDFTVAYPLVKTFLDGPAAG
ncbi:MAG TPA: serine protease, partial [Usitatibacter sp.]